MQRVVNTENFDVWLFHFDECGETVWNDMFSWSKNVFHITDVDLTKLEFASKYLKPKVVCEYEYILLFDGDAELPDDKTLNLDSLVETMRKQYLHVGSLSLLPGSVPTWQVQGATSEQIVVDNFVVWKTKTWLRAWSLLQQYPFRAKHFGRLPWRCILGVDAKNTALLHDHAVLHTGNIETLDDDNLPDHDELLAANVREDFGC